MRARVRSRLRQMPLGGLAQRAATADVCYTHQVTSHQVIRRLRKDGWKLVRTKGSHHQFKHPAKAGLVTVPHPKKDLPTGTVKAISRRAGWS
jgi:predicted RNA binding protein YcfA (HicA-like mRNA interferase family)